MMEEPTETNRLNTFGFTQLYAAGKILRIEMNRWVYPVRCFIISVHDHLYLTPHGIKSIAFISICFRKFQPCPPKSTIDMKNVQYGGLIFLRKNNDDSAKLHTIK